MKRGLVLGLSSLFLLAAGCGGSQPAAEAPTAAAPGATAGSAPAPSDVAKPSSEGGWEGEAEATAPAGAAPSGSTEPAATGGGTETRTMEVIAKIVKDHRQPVRDCYDKARKELPSLQGDMVIHFDLTADGKVKNAELNQQRSTLKASAVVDCAIKVIQAIDFPPSSRGMETSVNYPYNFTP